MARKKTIREAYADNPQCEWCFKKVETARGNEILFGPEVVVDSCEAEELRQQKQLSPAEPKPFQRKQLWCHIFLNNRDPDFELVPLVIGQAGCHLRKIYQATGAKIRIRGRGSGFL